MSTSSPENQLDRLGFSSHTGLNARVIDFRYAKLAQFFRGNSCLEMGSSDGRGIPCLLERFDRVVAVDGSSVAIDEIKRNFANPKMRAVCSYFEDLVLGEKFDTVLMGHILEHVDDPKTVIEVAMRHLTQDGVIIADVPNANSIHRHMGVQLGMIAKTNELNSADLSIGHQRVYERSEFERDFTDLGLNVVESGGFFMKPFSNAQIESFLSESQIDALLEIGSHFPDIAAEIYVVCTF